MMPHHAMRVNAMNVEALDYVLNYFGVRRRPRRSEIGWLPSVSLAESDIGQVDVVMALIASGVPLYVVQAEIVIGAPIQRLPMRAHNLAPIQWREQPDNTTPDRRRIVHVARDNPRKGHTGAAVRFRLFRAGMTLEQFYVRGGTRRDARQAIEAGWVRVAS